MNRGPLAHDSCGAHDGPRPPTFGRAADRQFRSLRFFLGLVGESFETSFRTAWRVRNADVVSDHCPIARTRCQIARTGLGDQRRLKRRPCCSDVTGFFRAGPRTLERIDLRPRKNRGGSTPPSASHNCSPHGGPTINEWPIGSRACSSCTGPCCGKHEKQPFLDAGGGGASSVCQCGFAVFSVKAEGPVMERCSLFRRARRV